MTNEIHANLVTLVNIYLKMARDPVITNLRHMCIHSLVVRWHVLVAIAWPPLVRAVQNVRIEAARNKGWGQKQHIRSEVKYRLTHSMLQE